MRQSIQIIQGGFSQDIRGRVSFNNTFNFKGVKRFYQLENSSSHPIRAFHGHMVEAKYFYVVSGSILLCLAPIDNPKDPSKDVTVTTMVLKSEDPKIIYVPPGYANGFRSLKKNTKVLVFSTTSLEDSIKDDYRYPDDYWGEKIWKTKK